MVQEWEWEQADISDTPDTAWVLDKVSALDKADVRTMIVTTLTARIMLFSRVKSSLKLFMIRIVPKKNGQ